MAEEIVKYARSCDCCGSGMNTGFLDDGATYCSTRCLVWGNSTKDTEDFESFEPYTESQWMKDCDDGDSDTSYWTEWYETIEEEDPYFDEHGTPYGKCHKCKEETRMENFCDNCGTCLS